MYRGASKRNKTISASCASSPLLSGKPNEKPATGISPSGLHARLDVGTADAEALVVKEIEQWARGYFNDSVRAPLLELLGIGGNGTQWGEVLCVPRRTDLEMLSVGEKRELLSSLQCHLGGGTNTTMFRHVFSAQVQKITETVHKIYKLSTVERGYSTSGHLALTSEDRRQASMCQSSLLYGELLPSAVTKILDDSRLCARKSTVVFDLGMGLGKCCFQAFLAFPNLKHVVGVELAPSRAAQAMTACRRLAHEIKENTDASMPSSTHFSWPGPKTKVDGTCSGHAIDTEVLSFEQGATHAMLRLKGSNRCLEVRQQNLFETEPWVADIVILETELPEALHEQLINFLSKLKIGARLLTYENLDQIFDESSKQSPFARLPVNIGDHDRYFTTWAYRFGHHFHLWRKYK